jgi:hypothetical protein
LSVSRDQEEEKRQLLKAIASDEFLHQLAYQCSAATQAEDTSRSRSTFWTWGRSAGSGSGSSNSSRGNTSSNQEVVVSTLQSILRRNLNSMMGDVALTDDEKNTKQLLQLTTGLQQQQQQLPTTVDDAIQKLAQEQSASNKSKTIDNNNSSHNNESWIPESPAGDKSKKKSVFVI